MSKFAYFSIFVLSNVNTKLQIIQSDGNENDVWPSSTLYQISPLSPGGGIPYVNTISRWSIADGITLSKLVVTINFDNLDGSTSTRIEDILLVNEGDAKDQDYNAIQTLFVPTY